MTTSNALFIMTVPAFIHYAGINTHCQPNIFRVLRRNFTSDPTNSEMHLGIFLIIINANKPLTIQIHRFRGKTNHSKLTRLVPPKVKYHCLSSQCPQHLPSPICPDYSLNIHILYHLTGTGTYTRLTLDINPSRSHPCTT